MNPLVSPIPSVFSSVKYAKVFNTIPLHLQQGGTLSNITVAYETYGTLNNEKSNAVWVCHALTGNAHAYSDGTNVPGWWDGLIGKNLALDPGEYFIICSNILGSCYGSTGPASHYPADGLPWRKRFPLITVRDMVQVQHALLEHLGIERLQAVVGGSLGGMQVLEWALMYPEKVARIIPIATAASHSAWAIAWNEAARRAIVQDPAFQNGGYNEQPVKGLGLARWIAMISYRSQKSYQDKFARGGQPCDQINPDFFYSDETAKPFAIEHYLDYQGKKLTARFDAFSYIRITQAMDRHDVTEGRGSLDYVLHSIRAKVLCIGIRSDVLYPAEEQKAIARGIKNARYIELDSDDGHDAFLIKNELMNETIAKFLKENE